MHRDKDPSFRVERLDEPEDAERSGGGPYARAEEGGLNRINPSDRASPLRPLEFPGRRARLVSVPQAALPCSFHGKNSSTHSRKHADSNGKDLDEASAVKIAQQLRYSRLEVGIDSDGPTPIHQVQANLV